MTWLENMERIINNNNKNLLELVNDYNKVAKYTVNIEKSILFFVYQ